MTSLPLRSIFISDFRRLEGHRTLPLDAPVVLVHGPNGAGKTSVLAALELALTGDIRSMRRHDPRYTAHLPFHGQEFAAIRAEVADELAVNSEPVTMTVGGSRIDGVGALSPAAGQFYTERCYLDQVSLGQLLELYQYREAKEESALARFVNELLGLEQLDALRMGLTDAMDFRRLKKLSEPLNDAEAEAGRATADKARLTEELESARQAMGSAQSALTEAMEALGLATPELVTEESLRHAADLLGSAQPMEPSAWAEVERSVTALGGRIGALANRPAVRRLEEVQAALGLVSAEYARWSGAHGVMIDAWRADATDAGLEGSRWTADALENEIQRVDRALRHQGELTEATTQMERQLDDDRVRLQAVEIEMASAQEQAGSLAEGLAALRDHAVDNACPVCDRDFGEVSSTHLTSHIDLKIAALTARGVQLRQLRQQRDAVAMQVQRGEQALDQARAELWSAAQLEATRSRRGTLFALRQRFQELEPAIIRGGELERQRDALKSEVEELEAVTRDVDLARSELASFAQTLGTIPWQPGQTLEDVWRQLADVARQRNEQRAVHDRARQLLGQAFEAARRLAMLKDAVAESAEREVVWDRRVKEARRRQAIARAVHDASSKARAAIVQRVFTESLNEVWRGVFTRLAPREPFVPAFGIPSSSKTALELTLETVHTSGESGGSPQMMLSAGNLNTAALSLFIALHLAVDPLVPCLVLDDPVQSMDEVHVAQFAGLIRVLSKHHSRQVIIAVHERELFQYLALELSPAFQGDQLITIELGTRSQDEDRGITRHTWSPDPAIAV